MLNKIRVWLTLTTIILVSIFSVFFGYYARGYKFNLKQFKFVPNGILVVKSDPTAAEVYIDGELKDATDATIKLSPGTYDVSVQKEGYITWNKRLKIEKEVVTEADVNLFRAVPSLSPVTFTGVLNPNTSPDNTKLAYVVPPDEENKDKEGLWIMEIVNLPLGFSKDPRRITNGDLTNASWIWSPDGRQILLNSKTGVFLLDTGSYTPQAQRVNVASTKATILSDWEKESKNKLEAKIKTLPDRLNDILLNKTSSVVFSPDENKIMYTASSSATIPEDLIKEVPGASTQKQERDIKPGKTYIYDIKEDRNFLIETSLNDKKIFWFPTSNQVLVADSSGVSIEDYDGTNKQPVYSGSYISPFAFPTLKEDRILVLTDLGSNGSLPNLYSLSLK